MTRRPRTSRADSLAQGLLFISAGLLALALYLRLSATHDDSNGGWGDLPVQLVGARAAHFRLATVGGDTVLLPRDGVRMLLIASSSKCRFSQASIPVWRKVAQEVCSADIVVASAEPLETLASYWGQRSLHGCGNTFIGSVLNAPELARSYEITGTPVHYVVDENGIFQRVWYGVAEGGRAAKQISESLR